MKNTFIGLLAVAAIAILVGIWISAKQDIVESEMETYESPSKMMENDMMVAPEGDMMVPEMMENDMMMDETAGTEATEENSVVTDLNVEVNVSGEATTEAEPQA